jgi:hypothetical protein
MTTELQTQMNTSVQPQSTTTPPDFWAQLDNLQRHPAYVTGPQADPVRALLAAVVLRVVNDVNPNRKVKMYYRETARQFLTDKEGQEWLKCFGIPPAKIMSFVENLD